VCLIENNTFNYFLVPHIRIARSALYGGVCPFRATITDTQLYAIFSVIAELQEKAQIQNHIAYSKEIHYTEGLSWNVTLLSL
jgi:hypothetical protein